MWLSGKIRRQYVVVTLVVVGSLIGGLWYLAGSFKNGMHEYYQQLSVSDGDVLSPCASREPSLATCSEFAAACVAYFKSPKAPTDPLRSQMGDMGVNSCVEWKDQCLNTGMWQGPNCVIINVSRR
jgi:hypothetical protein